MKKNNFINGAVVATFGIVISKIIGIIYVIPFYDIIGEQGGALYGYAYSMYSLLLTVSTIGIPLAMSKIISEYLTKGYMYTKEKVFKLGLIVVNTLGIMSFLILLVVAPVIANGIVGGTTGGNSVEDVTFVLRCMSIAILIVPSLSVTKGYLQGHRYINITSISQVIEQLARVGFVLIGSSIVMNVLKLDLVYAVGIAVLGAFIGGVVAFLYLFIKMKKERITKKESQLSITEEEKSISDAFLIKKVLAYSIPFITIALVKDAYNFTDALMVVRTMANQLGYTIQEAETTMGVITTWGTKLNMIIIALASGMTISLLPNITKDYVEKNQTALTKKVNQAYQIILFIALPITLTLAVFSDVVWGIFYGVNPVESNIYSYYVFVALASVMLSISVTILQSFNSFKEVIISLVTGAVINAFCNIPFMILADRLGLKSFYGNISSTILGYLASLGICLYFITKKYKIKLDGFKKSGILIFFATTVYLIIILLLVHLFGVDLTSRFKSIFQTGIYVVIGLIPYGLLTYKKILKPNLKNLLRRKKH